MQARKNAHVRHPWDPGTQALKTWRTMWSGYFEAPPNSAAGRRAEGIRSSAPAMSVVSQAMVGYPEIIQFILIIFSYKPTIFEVPYVKKPAYVCHKPKAFL